jgi:N6-adenosine-specific RNA methylase IME4
VTRYRTIVADPPWEYPEGFALGPGHGTLEVRPLPYAAMSFEAICELPVQRLADRDSRLFLWTTNRHLDDAFDVMHAWGFKYRQTLVWHKRDVNLPASIAPNSAEFLLVGTHGAPARGATLPSSVIATTRRGGHSAKPEVWLDYIEQASPGPYVELFARRARFGWDYWGDQSLGTAKLEAGT